MSGDHRDILKEYIESFMKLDPKDLPQRLFVDEER